MEHSFKKFAKAKAKIIADMNETMEKMGKKLKASK